MAREVTFRQCAAVGLENGLNLAMICGARVEGIDDRWLRERKWRVG